FWSRKVLNAMAKISPKYLARSPVSMRRAMQFIDRPVEGLFAFASCFGGCNFLERCIPCSGPTQKLRPGDSSFFSSSCSPPAEMLKIPRGCFERLFSFLVHRPLLKGE